MKMILKFNSKIKAKKVTLKKGKVANQYKSKKIISGKLALIFSFNLYLIMAVLCTFCNTSGSKTGTSCFFYMELSDFFSRVLTNFELPQQFKQELSVYIWLQCNETHHDVEPHSEKKTCDVIPVTKVFPYHFGKSSIYFFPKLVSRAELQ